MDFQTAVAKMQQQLQNRTTQTEPANKPAMKPWLVHPALEDIPSSFDQSVCVTCRGMGFIVQVDQTKIPGADGWQTTIVCPDADCPTVRRNREERFARIVAKAPLPVEYRQLTFDHWGALSQAQLTGKWLAYGSALAFTDARESAFYFTLQNACDRLGIGPDIYKPSDDYAKNSIVFWGINGVGKTSLVASIANFLSAYSVPCLYVRASDILQALRETYNGGDKELEYHFGTTEQQTMNTFRQAPVLIIDEFNLERASDYSRQKLEDIIRHRMGERLPTLMTTNLDADRFNDHWGSRTSHAVDHMAHWIPIGGKDMRHRNRNVEAL